MDKTDVMKIKVNCREHAIAIVKAFSKLNGYKIRNDELCTPYYGSSQLYYNSISRGRISNMSGTDGFAEDFFKRHHGIEVTLKDIIKLGNNE